MNFKAAMTNKIIVRPIYQNKEILERIRINTSPNREIKGVISPGILIKGDICDISDETKIDCRERYSFDIDIGDRAFFCSDQCQVLIKENNDQYIIVTEPGSLLAIDNHIKIKPTRDNVIICPIAKDEKTLKDEKLLTGKIIAISQRMMFYSYASKSVELNVGDTVIFESNYKCYQLETDNEDIHILTPRLNIVAIEK